MKWTIKEKTKVDQPNTVELVSFGSDEFFGKWTKHQNFKGLFEMPYSYYE